MANNISYKNEKTSFNIASSLCEQTKINLNCPGEHNIYNALAATAISLELDIPIKNIKIGLEKYMGVKRRFDIKYNNKNNKIIIIDDYAHHPSEIFATLQAAKKGWGKRIIAIFQPHLFSRTRDFYKEFSSSLSIADVILLTDIYPAREKPLKGISSNMILNELINIGHKNSMVVNNIEDIPEKIIQIVKNGDMIISMGAGSISHITNKIIKKIEENE
jgi:UDP-N-acetylmuramate--alanine ligase